MRLPPSSLAPLLTVVAVGTGLGACDGAGKPNSQPPALGTRYGTAYQNDGDFDNGDGDPDNARDTDKDAPFDYYDRTNESWNRGYFHDRDDLGELTVGRAADTKEAQTIASVVTRYYATALQYDGRRACAMLIPAIAASMADYSHTGIPYLRGARNCADAMGRLFRHDKLTVPHVTNVRLGNHTATAIWGSRTMPAGYLTLERLHGKWLVTAPVGSPLL